MSSTRTENALADRREIRIHYYGLAKRIPEPEATTKTVDHFTHIENGRFHRLKTTRALTNPITKAFVRRIVKGSEVLSGNWRPFVGEPEPEPEAIEPEPEPKRPATNRSGLHHIRVVIRLNAHGDLIAVFDNYPRIRPEDFKPHFIWPICDLFGVDRKSELFQYISPEKKDWQLMIIRSEWFQDAKIAARTLGNNLASWDLGNARFYIEYGASVA